MLRRTMRKTRLISSLVFISILGALYYQVMFNTPSYENKANVFIKDAAFYKPKAGKNVLFELSLDEELDKKDLENKNNYEITQVKKESGKFVNLEKGKKITIDFVQYVFAPNVDTQAKKDKVEEKEKNKKVLQLFSKIEPSEEKEDLFMIKVKKLKAKESDKISENEFFVVKVTGLNNIIKR